MYMCVYIYIYIYISEGGWLKRSGPCREIVSFRSCVRAGGHTRAARDQRLPRRLGETNVIFFDLCLLSGRCFLLACRSGEGWVEIFRARFVLGKIWRELPVTASSPRKGFGR